MQNSTSSSPATTHPIARGEAPEQAEIARAVLNAEPRPGAPDDAELAKLPLNDLGNRDRFIRRNGGDLLTIDEMGWHAWDGTRWSAKGGEATSQICAQRTAEDMAAKEVPTLPDFDEPEPPEGDTKEAHTMWKKRRDHILGPRLALKAFALKSGNVDRCRAMVQHAAPHLRIDAESLDADPWKFNVRNGTIHLNHGRALYPHRRSDWITKLANVTYDANADYSRWERFIEKVLPDAGSAHLVHKWLGYSACGDVGEQRIFLCEGRGSNGKSTLLEVIARLMGDYAVVVPIDTFLHQERRSGSGPSPDIARLRGARMVRASEPEIGARLSESTIKQFTGGEKMTARQLHRDFMEFLPCGKLTLSANFLEKTMVRNGAWSWCCSRRASGLTTRPPWAYPAI